MIIDAKNLDEKPQTDINRESRKLSVLSLGKIDKYKYIKREEILPPDQSRVIEQTMFTYSPLGKAFENKQKNKTKERSK